MKRLLRDIGMIVLAGLVSIGIIVLAGYLGLLPLVGP